MARRGSESSTLETDVYIWHYALLVVHASKEEEDIHGLPSESYAKCKICITSRSPLTPVVASINGTLEYNED